MNRQQHTSTCQCHVFPNLRNSLNRQQSTGTCQCHIFPHLHGHFEQTTTQKHMPASPFSKPQGIVYVCLLNTAHVCVNFFFFKRTDNPETHVCMCHIFQNLSGESKQACYPQAHVSVTFFQISEDSMNRQ